MKNALVASVFTVLLAGSAVAGTQDQAAVALHVKAHQTASNWICPGGFSKKNRESTDPNTKGIHCWNYTVETNLTKTDVYVVVANAKASHGVAAVSFGIDYGVHLRVEDWNLCADFQSPSGSWPASGSGNRVSWNAVTRCQNGSVPSDDQAAIAGVGHGRDFGPCCFNVHAIVGALYMYSYVGQPDILQITKNNGLVIPEFKVADCNGSESELDDHWQAGAIGYQGDSGYRSCPDLIPVSPTTWGAIKSRRE